MFYVLCSANEQLIECVFLWHDGLRFQNHMAQRHHLSKALVVSLMKNHYFKKSSWVTFFCSKEVSGKGRTL